ncbi:DUF4249 domain-containing protein [Spirosoma montaniterrae]|nr:DUF4249 domain-containing protein [Spirosoma montaniterrae]
MKAKSYSLLLGALLGLSSCEKVIDVDLRDTDTKTVIEGNITDQAGPYTVRVSQTANFNESGTGQTLDNATVLITDNTGQRDTLRGVGNGLYQTRTLRGTPGRAYTLSVTVGGKLYTATSTMPQPVVLDKLTYEDAGPGSKAIYAHFDDPANAINQYRFVMWINDKRQDAIFISDDRLRNGIRNRIALFSPGASADEVEPNDNVRVEMQGIDAGVYDYFKSLSDLLGGQSASPANPNTNLSGGAVGYFSAQTVSTNSLLVK